MRTELVDLVEGGGPVLGDCATGTRLQFQSPLATDEQLGLVPLVDNDLGAAAIRAVSAGHVVIDRIESIVSRPPMYWVLCCVHPDVARRAMEVVGASDPHAHDRVRQLKGNGSAASGDERERRPITCCATSPSHGPSPPCGCAINPYLSVTELL